MAIKIYCDNKDCNKELEFNGNRKYEVDVNITGKNVPMINRKIGKMHFVLCKKCFFKTFKDLR